MGHWLRRWLDAIVQVPELRRVFQCARLRRLVSLALALATGLGFRLFRLGQALVRWLRGHARDAARSAAGTLFYRRLVQLLAAYDLERTPAETQSEFAGRATSSLTGRGRITEPSPMSPSKSSRPFIRFGSVIASSTPTRSTSSMRGSTRSKPP